MDRSSILELADYNIKEGAKIEKTPRSDSVHQLCIYIAFVVFLWRARKGRGHHNQAHEETVGRVRRSSTLYVSGGGHACSSAEANLDTADRLVNERNSTTATVEFVDHMAPIIHMESIHHGHQPYWVSDSRQQTRGGGSGGGGGFAPHQDWVGAGAGSQMHTNAGPIVLARDIVDDGVFATSAHHNMAARGPMMARVGTGSASLQPAPMLGGSKDLLCEGTFMGRGYSIKRCQGFVRCDMDIDAEVVGWVIGKNGEFIPIFPLSEISFLHFSN